MSALKFYTDTHIAKAVAEQLRAQGIDVLRCEEAGMATASDEAHLRFAAQNGRAVITKDDDFLRLHTEWQEQRKSHAGIFFSRERHSPAIGIIVKACAEYHALIEAEVGTLDDIRNRVVFI